MELDPIGERIIIRRIKERQTASGIILPDDKQDHALVGEVIRAGDDCEYVQVGQKVLFGRYSGVEIDKSLPLETYLSGECEGLVLMCEDDVLALVRD